MKKLICGTEVLASIYYYLLDFNDRDNHKTMQFLYEKTSLLTLTKSEFYNLFYVASQSDMEKYNKK